MPANIPCHHENSALNKDIWWIDRDTGGHHRSNANLALPGTHMGETLSPKAQNTTKKVVRKISDFSDLAPNFSK